MTQQTPLVLVDGSSYFFRAFHALPPLTNSEGHPTGAVYGVVNMVRRLYKDIKPSHFAIVFDAPGKTFRHELYADYKANRPPMPDDLKRQFKPMLDTLDALGFPILMVEGVEADDVIGTLASRASHRQMPVLISTGDKDMAQLVNEHVTLINTMSKQTLDEDGVFEKFGVKPNQIIDYLTLMGDSSDNIPGVPQCGPKTASKWLKTYETLDTLIENADDVGGKIGEKLRAHIAHLAQSKALVTIKKDVSLPLDIDELTPKPPDRERLLTLAGRLEANIWLKEWGSDADEKSRAPSLPAKIIQTEDAFQKLLHELSTAKLICIDTETTSLNPLDAKLVGLAISIADEPGYYIPLSHKNVPNQLSTEYVLTQLKPILENKNIQKVGQNLKYDIRVLKQYHIDVYPISFDTMLESYVLNSTATRHNLDALAEYYLNHKTIHFEDIAGKGKKALTFDEIPLEEAAPYAIEDVDITLKLHQALYPKLDDALQKVFHTLEVPLISVLADIEHQGVLIDTDLLSKHGDRLKDRIASLTEQAYALSGETFNLNSTKQLQEILYTKLELPVLTKTPKGQPSTAEAALQALAFDYELPKVILEYRSLSKLVSTYIDALPKYVHASTGRVHTSYNQAVTATGRLSSSEPNLQNIPVKTEEGKLIRQAFIAPEGHTLLAADYSQIELRVMAHLSKDAGLIDAFKHDLDIHAATASEVFNMPLDKVTPDARRKAKAINFGLIYGMSAFGLAKQLGVPREDADAYIKRYFERYPGVKAYMEETRKLAHEQGYVETLCKRRLYLPEINASNKLRQKAAERTAINAPMQGTAADIIKQAMITIHAALKTKPEIKLIMQVHDELVFEVPDEQIESATKMVRQHMEAAMALSVPLKVSVGLGKNWDAAH